MEFLIMDMTQAIPHISASDYFNISKGLFPQVNLLKHIFVHI